MFENKLYLQDRFTQSIQKINVTMLNYGNYSIYALIKDNLGFANCFQNTIEVKWNHNLTNNNNTFYKLKLYLQNKINQTLLNAQQQGQQQQQQEQQQVSQFAEMSFHFINYNIFHATIKAIVDIMTI